MKKKLFRKALLLSTMGPLLMNHSSCTLELRDAAISAGATFVGTTVANVLDALIPVDDLLGGAGGG
jgi:hypothetical protein